MPEQIIAIIPARYESTRLPRKLLLELGGKSILQRTYEQVLKSKLINKVIIAVDDQRLLEHAQSFGAEAALTSTEHQSGTDRIAELAAQNPEWQIIVNVQGDEPFINPTDIDKAIEPFIHDPLLKMSSLYHRISDPAEIEANSNVKVVTDINDFALYFSRSAIPYERDKILRSVSAALQDSAQQQNSSISLKSNSQALYKKHIGLYAYRRETLLILSQLAPTELERAEKLEQLRALQNSIAIKMVEVKSAPIGIDTELDYEKAKELVAN